LEKIGIISEIGEERVLLPGLVNRGLDANEKTKYYFTLLQAARAAADEPDRPPVTLQAEREAAGIEDDDLDSCIGNSERGPEGMYTIACLREILDRVHRGIQEMIHPLEVGEDARAEGFRDRLGALYHDLPGGDGGGITGVQIERVTSGRKETGDSLHLLVMDLHRALNEMQAGLAEEVIDGARAYLLTDRDRSLVRAFMAGLNRTAPLKFDHPGLGTTATRSGDRLVIQNDIGLTDAHVLVIRVEDSGVTITYTDVHLPRLLFFHSLFEGRKVAWEDTRSRAGGEAMQVPMYHLSLGRYQAGTREDLAGFLEYLGSRIVFLIDWNRARKRLRQFLPNQDSVGVLKWAADHDAGHMGFLTLGGERLLFDALELAARMPLKYGEPLHRVLGREKTVEFLCWVMKTTATGLLAGQSRALIQDEVKAELLRSFRSAHQDLIDVCADHASFTVEVATALVASLQAIARGEGGAAVDENAHRAKEWESEADRLVSTVRSLSRRVESAGFYVQLMVHSDDALDYLEEACFYTTIGARQLSSPAIIADLSSIGAIALEGSREFVKALYAAQGIQRGGSAGLMQDFLGAVDRVVTLEHTCDDALRKAEGNIFRESSDYRELRLAFELARTTEEATNSLMKAAFLVRDELLERGSL
jgi:uncharacterized protein Yka (UPF0111/DUF47 family)